MSREPVLLSVGGIETDAVEHLQNGDEENASDNDQAASVVAGEGEPAVRWQIGAFEYEFGQKVVIDGLEECDAALIGQIVGYDEDASGGPSILFCEQESGEEAWYDADTIRPWKAIDNPETRKLLDEMEEEINWEREWAAKVREKSERCKELENEYEDAKEAAKDAKQTLDLALKGLRALTSQRYDRESMPLFNQSAKPADDETATATAGDTPDQSWRDVSVSDLIECGLPSNVRDLLHAADFQTIGKLADHTAAERHLTDIPKIGPAKATAIEDALIEFWRRRGTDAPEVTEDEPDGPDDAA